MRHVQWLFATALVGTAAMAALPARAQINPFRSSFATGLKDQDFKIIQQATTTLLSHDPLPNGTTEKWTNPATGTHGSVATSRTFKHTGYECHVVNYVATRSTGKAATRQTLNWCKTPAGWKIL